MKTRRLLTLLTILGLIGMAHADIVVDTESSTEFSGSFSYDSVGDGFGLVKLAVLFPHFSFDGVANGQFQVNLDGGGTITLQGYDLGLSTPSGPETFTVPVFGETRQGTFTSLFDGSTIQYEFSNVSTAVVSTGDFSYTVIPEPATAGLIGVGAICMLLARKLPESC